MTAREGSTLRFRVPNVSGGPQSVRVVAGGQEARATLGVLGNVDPSRVLLRLPPGQTPRLPPGFTPIRRDDLPACSFALAERRGQLAGTLSGGEQQMLAIGRAMMGRPRILMVDEPSLGLSPKLAEEVLATLARVKAEGVGVLLVEQNVALSLEVADRGYVVEHGKVVLQGSAAALAQNEAVQKAYLAL